MPIENRSNTLIAIDHSLVETSFRVTRRRGPDTKAQGPGVPG
jgi:hypothetical protein